MMSDAYDRFPPEEVEPVETAAPPQAPGMTTCPICGFTPWDGKHGHRYAGKHTPPKTRWCIGAEERITRWELVDTEDPDFPHYADAAQAPELLREDEYGGIREDLDDLIALLQLRLLTERADNARMQMDAIEYGLEKGRLQAALVKLREELEQAKVALHGERVMHVEAATAFAKAEAALAEAQERVRWIPVSERLPVGDGKVLVLAEDGTIYTTWCRVWEDINDEDAAFITTHWRPLPTPPKGEHNG